MKEPSVFVLLLGMVCCSCYSGTQWTVDTLSGTYVLAPKEKPVMERLFEHKNVSGWNYDDPYITNLQLNGDGTYQESLEGSCFEAPSYYGKWCISNDTLFLDALSIDSPDGVVVEMNAPPILSRDTLLITSQRELLVVELSGTEEGRILQRK